tara:strand:+ start:2650 stop:3426 length:777 start_codon:yes stop_codon:yes gene_type:complete
MAFKVIDLFSGIGGFSLGLESTGHFETVAFCEIEEFPRKVLKKHWPNIPIYRNIKDVKAKRLISDGIECDVVTGGFPCVDISTSGRQKGIEGSQSGLWKEMYRVISQLRPKYVIVENVSALLSGGNGRWFGRVLGDLARLRYDATWYSISAAQLGALHKRKRVFILSYPGSTRRKIRLSEERHREKGNTKKPNDSSSRFGGWEKQNYWATEPNVGRLVDGIPNRVDRLKCLGNAVVPQIARLLGETIIQHENAHNRLD